MVLPLPDVPPSEPTAVADIDWVLDLLDRHVTPLPQELRVPAMAVAYGVGFAGATRMQVWWVLREERLRAAIASILVTARRLPTADPPPWASAITEQPPAVRRRITEQAAAQAALDPTAVPREPPELFDACRRHPDAVASSSADGLAVPHGVLTEVADIARSISMADIMRVLDAARGPVARRLAEADAALDADGRFRPPAGEGAVTRGPHLQG